MGRPDTGAEGGELMGWFAAAITVIVIFVVVPAVLFEWIFGADDERDRLVDEVLQSKEGKP